MDVSVNDSGNTRAALPAPRIPLALDGGLGYDDLARTPDIEILVQVGPWSDFQDGDTLQILWGPDERIVASRAIAKSDADTIVDVFVPAKAIQNIGDGTHEVKARVVPGFGQAITSTPTTVLIKLSVPGGHDPDAHTPYANENLAAPVIAPAIIEPGTPEATVEIAAYDNMAEGDLVTVRWNREGNDILYGPVSQTEADGRVTLTVPIDRDTIDHGGVGDAVKITYQVYDRVRNWSLWSPYAQVSVTDPLAPPAPWVEGTLDDMGEVLDVDRLAGANLTVLVEGSGAVVGDQVTVHWAGETAAGQPVTHDTDAQSPTRPSQTLTFSVPNDKVKPLAQGNARAWYTILPKAGGSERTSARRNLALTGQAVQYLAPRVLEAKGNTLDPADLATFAHAIVPAWPGMQVGDEVTLVGEGKKAGGLPANWSEMRPVSGGSLDQDIPIDIPRDFIASLLNGSLRLYYLILPFGSARNSSQRTVRAALRSDPLDLEIRDATGQPLLAPPSIPQLDEGVLDPDKPDTVHLEIPAYTGIAFKDRVDAAIRGGVKDFNDWLPVSSSVTPPSFALPRDFIEANRDSALEATYAVTRAAGDSANSEPLAFRIGKDEPVVLPAPTVLQGPAGTLNPIDATGGATVQVSYTGMLATDTIRILWNGNDTYPTQAGSTSGSVSFAIPAADVGLVIGKTIPVLYTVTRDATSTDAETLSLIVQPLPDTSLPPVEIRGSVDGVLDLSTFTGDSAIILAPWPFISTQVQRRWMYASGTNADGSPYTNALLNGPVTTPEVSNGEAVRILRSDLEGLKEGSSLTAEFRVAFDGSDARNGQAFPSKSVTIRLRKPLYIDPSQVNLTGTGSYTRSATGGTPPYSHESSKPGIVAVLHSNSGDIRGVSDGDARITARDNAGDSGSYPVHVSGNTPFYINPSQVNLTGTASYTRSATGGTPPYTYTSNRPEIVVVTDSGTGAIRGASDGDATITASDTAGGKGSYPVHVSGNTPFYIDPSQVNLTGTGSYTRSATGGIPPYTYESSKPGIVAIPDVGAGGIRGVSDGDAVITARDNAQGVGTYPVRVTGNVPPFTYDLTNFTDYNWNEWEKGPASRHDLCEIVLQDGNYRYRNRTPSGYQNEGMLLSKTFTNLTIGSSYEISFSILNRHEWLAQHAPIISICVTDAGPILEHRVIDETGWIKLRATFRATAPTMDIWLYNHEASGEGNDFEIDYIAVKAL